jgi:RNA polymerase sigma factor (sigma-70 family)
MAMTAEVHAIDRETEALFARLDGVDPALQRSLDDLPDASRRAVEARVLHGQSYEEIADELQCTPLAVRIRVSRAMTTLRNDLSIETREGNTA